MECLLWASMSPVHFCRTCISGGLGCRAQVLAPPISATVILLQRISSAPNADLTKCDIEGSEREVFADRKARWHQDALCVTVETHDEWIPGCLATVEACFDPAKFDRRR